MPRHPSAGTSLAWPVVAGLAAITLAAVAQPSAAATLSRSIDVKGSPAAVWSQIGRFCAIQDWHPAIASCALDGRTPPTRTLVTADKATFVERQVMRDDAAHAYGYAFISSPLPVSNYRSTFKVTAKGEGLSTITWSGVWTPEAGKEKAAVDALSGIYESGLESIRSKLAR